MKMKKRVKLRGKMMRMKNISPHPQHPLRPSQSQNNQICLDWPLQLLQEHRIKFIEFKTRNNYIVVPSRLLYLCKIVVCSKIKSDSLF